MGLCGLVKRIFSNVTIEDFDGHIISRIIIASYTKETPLKYNLSAKNIQEENL